MDPLLDLIHLLRPRATLWGGIDASGDWAVWFQKRDDVLFCWMERGECLLMREHDAPLRLRQGDFILLRSTSPFALGSADGVEPLDIEAAVASTRDTRIRVGRGTDTPVTLQACKFVFDSANEDLLTGLLPPQIHIPDGDTSSDRVRGLLAMNAEEWLRPGPGAAFAVVRLMELVLLEIFRDRARGAWGERAGLLAGLADPVTARALSAIHESPAHPWTVAELARLCGVSRSSFAARFREIVGSSPIDYLSQWRMALAKDELRRGTRSVGEIARAVGFESSSAFSTSFTRAVGCSPTRFAAG